MNNPLTTDRLIDVCDSINYMIEVCWQTIDDRVLADMVYGILAPVTAGYEGSPSNEQLKMLAINIVTDYVSDPSVTIDTFGMVAEACHSMFFCAMHTGGEFHPCMACGARWRLDDTSEVIEHYQDCAYLVPLIQQDDEFLATNGVEPF